MHKSRTGTQTSLSPWRMLPASARIPALRRLWLTACLVLVGGCSKPPPIPEIKATIPSASVPSETGEKSTELAWIEPAPGDWPWWRGLEHNASSPKVQPPTNWSDVLNVAWKSPVPGRGHSSPIVRGDHVYLATADETAKTQSLLAYDRVTGKSLWGTVLHTGGIEHAHAKNTQASATPACDGERVFITFLNNKAVWLSAVDLEGKKLWSTDVGPFETLHGFSASPALHKSLVIVSGESHRGGFLAAVNRQSGEIVWRVQRAAETSFSSPIVARIAGKDQILMQGGNSVDGYNPDTGEKIWWYTGGPAETTSGTVTYEGDRVFVSGGYPAKQTLCIRADGAGDITKTHLVWKISQKFYVPSLLVHDGLIYAVEDTGIVHCYQASDGKQIWVRRLGGDFSASPVFGGKFVYLVNEAGRMFVMKPGPEALVVAENNLHDGGFATPAISGDQIFIRTDHSLFCIAQE